MEPVLRDGSFILGENITYKFRNPRAEDLVIFCEPETGILAVKKIVSEFDGCYLVLGVNQNLSRDSRHYGLIHRNDIAAKAIKV